MSRSRHLIIHRSKTNMATNTSDPKQYAKQLLELYLHTPGTLGRIRREDRRLAVELYDRGVPLLTVEASFVLATARRCLRAPDAPALSPVRSLHYFVPVIEELLANPLPADYLEYLRGKLKKIRAVHEGKVLNNNSLQHKLR